jgi:8-oxo-dGTP pyrophosphatase MutT (NUDIX family)
LEPQDFEHTLTRALALNIPDRDRFSLPGKPSAVLVLFDVHSPGGPYLLLTQRTDLVEKHKGQIAFPGGVMDPEDEQEEGLVTTALRETEEEVGLSRDSVRVLGQLPMRPTSTGFNITPVVALLTTRREQVPFQLSPGEIAKVFWVPLSSLLEPATYRQEYYKVGAFNYPIHVFQVEEHRIWGATGSIIRDLVDRLLVAMTPSGSTLARS